MVVINGAGIAGLTLANALLAKKIAFLLIEKNADIQESGAGIILQNNGIAILKRLGVFDGLAHACPKKMILSTQYQTVEMTPAMSGIDTIVVHRQALIQALANNIPAENIVFNCQINQLIKHDSCFNVIGSNGKAYQADYVINAAGIHNNLHAEKKLTDSQLWCWRTVVQSAKPITASGEYWFGQHRVGIAPLSDKQVYIFHAFHPKKADQKADTPLSHQARIAWLQSAAKRVPVINQLNLVDCQWLSHPLVDRSINWGEGNLIAIGDAAHAMTPNLGQGAALAMEDAMTLAHIILATQHVGCSSGCSSARSNQHNATALHLKKLRHKRVKAMHRNSRFFGKVAHIENRLINQTFSGIVSAMPSRWLLNSQRAWMNQFIETDTW